MTGPKTTDTILQRHEPGERHRAQFFWQGCPQEWPAPADWSGSVETVLDKAEVHLSSLARCGALARGLWQVKAGGQVRDVKVD